MNEQLEKIFALPLTHKMGILIGSVFLLVGGYWYFMYQGLVEERSKLEKELYGTGTAKQGLKVEVETLQNTVAHLDQIEKEEQRLGVELKKALLELPDKSEMDRLLTRVSDKAKDSGLEVLQFAPQTEVNREFYAEQPVALEVKGTFHEIATFFDEVRHLQRIVNLDSFTLAGAGTQGDIEIRKAAAYLKSNVVATAFRFLDDSERPADPKESSKSKKGKKK